MPPADPVLAAVVAGWPTLSGGVKADFMALVRAAGPRRQSSLDPPERTVVHGDFQPEIPVHWTPEVAVRAFGGPATDHHDPGKTGTLLARQSHY